VRAVRRRSDRVMSAASRSRADTVEQGLGDAVGLFEGGKVARKGERVRLRVSNGVSYPRNEQFSSKQATLYAYLQGFCEKPSGRTRTVDPLLTMRSKPQPVAASGNGFAPDQAVFALPESRTFATGCAPSVP
jgi:hypothetical protein